MREQASAWLARLDAGASEAELEALHRWLDENPAHLPMLMEMASLWDELGVLSELSDMFPLKPQAPAPRRAPYRRALLAAAASLLVAAAGFGLLRTDPRDDSAAAPAAVAEIDPLRYETRIGEQATHVMADGSQIILNTNTLIEVEYSAGERNIWLRRGEGHFTVTKDANRPFRVHAGKGMAEAVGTAFAVQNREREGMEVTVTEGRVNLSQLSAAAAAPDDAGSHDAAAAPVELVAGERGKVADGDGAIEKEVVAPMEIEARLAWRHGMLIFEDDPLAEVLQEFSRYTAVRIEADESVRDIPVNGYLLAGDVEALIAHLRDGFNIQVQQISADHIVLTAQ